MTGAMTAQPRRLNLRQPSYGDFLAAKVRMAAQLGFAVEAASVNPLLSDHVRAIVPWACRGGRRALFASFGLQKTAMQIEILRQCLAHEGGDALIVVPLGVRHEFFLEQQARHPDIALKFIRSADEMAEPNRAGDGTKLIYLTNYETVRDGKLDLTRFTAASLDEAACLRGFGGSKTFREFMRLFDQVRYRFVATAVPDPNEYVELLAYAAFLGVMDVGEAKTRFFRRDSEKADRLTLHPHKEEEFWLWVASWALCIQRPSDLGFSDEGYDLPPLDVRWHEVASDHAGAGEERDGQARMFRNAALGVTDAARERRDSLQARIAKLLELRAEDPGAHRLIWHDLEAERAAIEAAVPGVSSVWGNLDLETREQRVVAFARGETQELATKPVLNGAGCNFQAHCHWSIYLGIGFKFHDFIQSCFRIQRFGQRHTVRLDLIYTEAEREIRRELERRWAQFDAQQAKMAEIIRRYGLATEAIDGALKRSLGVQRQEAQGAGWRAINNDCVDELRTMAADSIDLIVTSIPFSTQYEYTPSYNDFGHTDDDAHFWAQMDYLTPELLRVLKPGRNAIIHVKDRIVPGGINGLGFQTLSPFSDDCVAHFRRHGWAFLGRKTVPTDVVRENNQTYRLGWTEQCKDGTRMGVGLPEYGLIFRKAQTDRSKGYADAPVVKAQPDVTNPDGTVVRWRDGLRASEKEKRPPVPGTGYSRGRWQLDAHGVMRSSGDRLLLPDELRRLVALTTDEEKTGAYRGWREWCLTHPYDHETHVAFCEALDEKGLLPPTFMLLPPHSAHDDIWNVTRMRTLNGMQHAKGKELHLCPLQFDFVDRAIIQFSMPGETVLDPFGGLMTVPYCALKLDRTGIGIELNPGYWADGVAYCRAAESEAAVPTLFDLMGMEEAA